MKENIILTLGRNPQLNEAKNPKITIGDGDKSKFESHFVSAFKEQSAAIKDANGKEPPVGQPEIADIVASSETHKQFLKGGRSIIVGGENPTEDEVKAFAELQGIDPKGLIGVVNNTMSGLENTNRVKNAGVSDDGSPLLTGRENVPSQSDLDGGVLEKTMVFSDQGVSKDANQGVSKDVNQGILKDAKGTEITFRPLNFKDTATGRVVEQPLKNESKPDIPAGRSAANRTNISDGGNKSKTEDARILPSIKIPMTGREPKGVPSTFSELIQGETKFKQPILGLSSIEPIEQGKTLKDAQKIVLTSNFKGNSDVVGGSKGMATTQFEKGEIRRSITKMMENKSEFRGAAREIVSLAPIDLTDVIDQLPEELQLSTVRKSMGSHPEASIDVSNLRNIVKDSTLLSDISKGGVGKSQDPELDNGLLAALRRSTDLEPVTRKMSEIIGQRLLAQISKGAWRVEMELYPRSLGRVEIHLEMVNGQLEAHFQTNQSLTREILAEGIPRLKESLEEHGMESAYVSVELGNRKENDKNQTSSDQNGNLDSIVDSDQGQEKREDVNPIDLDGRLDFFV